MRGCINFNAKGLTVLSDETIRKGSPCIYVNSDAHMISLKMSSVIFAFSLRVRKQNLILVFQLFNFSSHHSSNNRWIRPDEETERIKKPPVTIDGQ